MQKNSPISNQVTNTVFLIRPAAFGYNVQTAVSNAFQNKPSESEENIKNQAILEFDEMAEKLKNAGVLVQVFEDTASPSKPDAIFPNNWISTHGDGKIILYPMCTPNRRLERRLDIVKELGKNKNYQVIDLSESEEKNEFLEGTGSMVLDRKNRKIYACLSPRTDEKLLKKVAQILDYKLLVFNALDENKGAIYHTNVMMSIGENFALICLESIQPETTKKTILDALKNDGLEVVEISLKQMNHFAGNMLALEANQKQILVLSQTAFDSLNRSQKQQLEQYATLLPCAIPTIEKIGGGSVRCMICEVF